MARTAGLIETELKKVERIERETSLFCLDDCIATLAGYYHCGYEMMYVGGYSMEEQQGIPGFASRYHVWLQHRFENLRRYHGLYIHKCDHTWRHSLIRTVRRELQEGRLVLILLNPYWCPWDDGFQRYDAVPGHCFLVQGEYQDGFLCADPYFEKDRLELSLAFFRKGIQEVYLVERVEVDSRYLIPEACRDGLEDMFQRLSGEEYFDILRNFLWEMDQSGDLFEEVRSDADFWISPLVVLLLQLNQSIQNMAAVTKYVAESCESAFLERQGARFWNLAVQWKQARKLVIKLYFIKKEDRKLREKTMGRLYSIVDSMEETAGQIAEGRKWDADSPEDVENVGNTVDTMQGNGLGEGYTAVCLESYMNNRAFLRMSGLQKGDLGADFSSIGNCYVLDDREAGCGIRIPGTDATIPAAGSMGNDNIACDGQEIRIPEGKYSRVGLVGAAEFGNSSDVLKAVSGNGREYEVGFCFTDYICEPCFGETVVWKGRGIHKLEDGYEWMPENLYLYGQVLEMPDAVVDRIILPVNPSIHLFAMVLWR